MKEAGLIKHRKHALAQLSRARNLRLASSLRSVSGAEFESRKSIMKMKKVKFYATLRGEGLITALPHTPSC
jgi:hypothetical protein